MRTPIQARVFGTQVSNALEVLDSDVGVGVGIFARQFLSELGLDGLVSAHDRQQASFKLPFKSVGNLKLSDKTYTAGDRQITKDETRKKCDELYRKSGKNVLWLETCEQVELSKSYRITHPKGFARDSESGFQFLNQIKLRQLEPYETLSGTLPKGVSAAQRIRFPYSAEQAKTMPPGAEVEISGEGQINFKSKFEVGLQATGKQSLSLKIQRLPEENKVLVKFTSSRGLEGKLGLHTEKGNNWSFTAVKDYLLHLFGLTGWFQPISANLEAKHQRNRKSISQYILDLSIEDQAKAYESIFHQLPGQASALRAPYGDRTGKESETCYELNASAVVGETPVTLFHVFESQKKACLNKINYQKFKSIYEHISKWFSKISVTWEWISFEDPEKKLHRSYCHVAVASPYASDFFDLTNSLQIPLLPEAKEVFSTHPQTEMHADISFTHQGIQNIQGASFEKAFESHLDEPFSPEKKRYGEIKNKWFFTRWLFYFELKDLESRLPELAQKSSQLKAAYRFADGLKPFKGSLRRFSGMKSIASLIKLAGREQVLVHDLSILGPGIGLKNSDEGTLKTPEEEFARELAAWS